MIRSADPRAGSRRRAQLDRGSRSLRRCASTFELDRACHAGWAMQLAMFDTPPAEPRRKSSSRRVGGPSGAAKGNRGLQVRVERRSDAAPAVSDPRLSFLKPAAGSAEPEVEERQESREPGPSAVVEEAGVELDERGVEFEVDARAGEGDVGLELDLAPHPTRGKLMPPEVFTEDEVRALIGACSTRGMNGPEPGAARRALEDRGPDLGGARAAAARRRLQERHGEGAAREGAQTADDGALGPRRPSAGRAVARRALAAADGGAGGSAVLHAQGDAHRPQLRLAPAAAGQAGRPGAARAPSRAAPHPCRRSVLSPAYRCSRSSSSSGTPPWRPRRTTSDGLASGSISRR